MSVAEYTQVSVLTNANISYEGRCSSHTILFDDGSKKMLGIILPNDDSISEYHFETHTSERIEILSGECQAKVSTESDYQNYRPGQSFLVAGNSNFKLKTADIIQYICHLEG